MYAPNSKSKPILKPNLKPAPRFDDSGDEDYDFSTDEASEHGGDDSKTDNMEEARGVAEKETQRLRFWRFVVTDVLIFVGVTLSLTGYAILRDMQDREMQEAFVQFAQTITDSTVERQQVAENALISLANTASIMEATNTTTSWPYYTLPKFETSAEQVRALTSSRIRTVSLNSMVEQGVSEYAWLDYSTSIHEQVVEENRRIAGSQDSDFEPIGYQPQITKLDVDNNAYIPDTLRDYYFPSLAWSSPPSTYETINWNLGSVPEFENILEGFLDSKLPKDSTVLSPHVQQSKVPFTAGVEESQDNQPLTYVFVPVLDNVNHDSFVAVVSGGFAWQDQLRNILPDSAKGIVVVVQTEGEHCNKDEDNTSSFSYQVDGHEVFVLGPGDRHDEMYEDYRVVMPLSASSATTGYCQYQLTFYPSKTFRKGYQTPFPEIACVALALAFFFVALVYFQYDILVDKRNEKLILRFARSNAIVSSLFPKEFHQRLMGDADSDTATAKNGNHGDLRSPSKLKSLMASGDAGDARTHQDRALKDTKTKPLADYFANVTILFADIVGFTAWSSVHEPSQVFVLLETLYMSFDKAAKGRRIFKIETVGDCYVAASGIPHARADHAVSMVRFAHDILQRMQVLTKELEMRLGPDTADLSLRVGIHSGAVTAGILRGEKARFQLFGDAMNTCSRLESSSKPGRIHISQATADLLVKGGKGHWIQKRAETVAAKGKGVMVTYWVISGADGGKDGESTTTSSSNDRTSREEDAPIKSKNKQPKHVRETREKVEQLPSNIGGDIHERITRLVEWNVEILLPFIKQIEACRIAKSKCKSSVKSSTTDSFDKDSLWERGDSKPMDEVQEIVALPDFDQAIANQTLDHEKVEISSETVQQLRTFIATIATMYNSNNPFHNFEHASHVTMSVTKLLSRIVAPTDMENHFSDLRENSESSQSGAAAMLHDHTYGITSDPVTQFACIFSALIHDVDHTGVPNSQLVKEKSYVADYYNNRSVAEQNSFDLSWELFMDRTFDDLRTAICATPAELQHFRQLVINSVMATDIVDKDLKGLRNARWDKAFAATSSFNVLESNEDKHQAIRDSVNRKATIVIEHLIQASDVSHTMQHWHVYRKWNERFFRECYAAYQAGRADKDPTEDWYKGELGFFDFYIIPLAKKLKDCGVFGVSSDEYLDYCRNNREEWEARGEAIVAEYKESLLRERQG